MRTTYSLRMKPLKLIPVPVIWEKELFVCANKCARYRTLSGKHPSLLSGKAHIYSPYVLLAQYWFELWINLCEKALRKTIK